MDVGVATPDIILLANTPSSSSLPAAREGRKKHKQDKKISLHPTEAVVLYNFVSI